MATEVNYLAPIHIAQVFQPHLKKTRGSLLLFTSSSYTRGRSGYSLYSSAKAAVVNLTQALADEWAADGMRVNCVNPERTATPMRTKAFGQEPEGIPAHLRGRRRDLPGRAHLVLDRAHRRRPPRGQARRPPRRLRRRRAAPRRGARRRRSRGADPSPSTVADTSPTPGPIRTPGSRAARRRRRPDPGTPTGGARPGRALRARAARASRTDVAGRRQRLAARPGCPDGVARARPAGERRHPRRAATPASRTWPGTCCCSWTTTRRSPTRTSSPRWSRRFDADPGLGLLQPRVDGPGGVPGAAALDAPDAGGRSASVECGLLRVGGRRRGPAGGLRAGRRLAGPVLLRARGHRAGLAGVGRRRDGPVRRRPRPWSTR